MSDEEKLQWYIVLRQDAIDLYKWCKSNTHNRVAWCALSTALDWSIKIKLLNESK